MEKEIRDWLNQAQEDYITAEACFEKKRYYATVIFSQQSAEKALKAVFVFLKEKIPPKIHDLTELSRLTDAPQNIFSQSEKLTVTYFSSRYPGAAPEIPAKFYTKEKAKHHLKEAEVILKWAQKKIQL